MNVCIQTMYTPVLKATGLGRIDLISAFLDGGASIDSSLPSYARSCGHDNAAAFIEQLLREMAMYVLLLSLRDEFDATPG
jgi:hypothetical protein